MFNRALGFIVALFIMIPVAWGWGAWQHHKGVKEVVCVAGKKPVLRKNVPSDELPFDIPFLDIFKMFVH